MTAPALRALLLALTRKISLAFLANTLLLTLVQAGDSVSDTLPTEENKIFSISGFGTLGVVHSSEDKADFTSTFYKPDGPGFSHNWSADVDSLVGVQLNADFTPQLSAVVQLISEQNYDGTYEPHVEWAHVKYRFTPDFSVSLGREVLPDFLASSYRKVNYANPWVRPPIEVYRLLPTTTNDGVHLSYRMHFGEITNTVRATYGSSSRKSPAGGEDRARNQWGIFNTAEYGPWQLHLGHHRNKLDSEGLRPVFDTFRLFGPEGVALAEKYDCDGKTYGITTVGASYDPGNWFLMSEFGRVNSHCFIGALSGWYVSSGYRFGKFTPYIVYAESNVHSNTSESGLNTSSLPPFLVGPASQLNGLLSYLIASAPAQQTVSIGGRWDVMKNTAIKVQVDHTELDNGSVGPLIMNAQPDFVPGGHFTLFSVSLDFLF